MNIFKLIFGGIWAGLKTVFKGERDVVIRAAKELAIEAVETAAKLDLNGDGRIATAKGIVHLAERHGLAFAEHLLRGGTDGAVAALQAHYSDEDLRRYYALARLGARLAWEYRARPKTKYLNWVIETAVNARAEK